jgi:uncharacterized delta-60 repeat protein
MSAIALLKPTKGYLPYRIASQSDGKNIVVGWFTTWNNITANRVVRLNLDGSLDRQFLNNIGSAANSIVYSVAIQSDGKIILGGNFSTWNGVSVGYLVRLNSNGTLDSTFSSGLNGPVFDIKIQSDGKILAAGEFAISSGVAARRFIRLNSNGTNDTAFITNTGDAARTFTLGKYNQKINFASPFESVKTIQLRDLRAQGIGAQSLASVSLEWQLQWIFYYSYEGEF